MGKKDKNKKKGKGAEKTAAKTEKKESQRRKKQLAAIGEDDIEKIVAEIEQEERKRLQVVERVVEAPTRRANFTFVSHPSKDELILFGGEYFNGMKTFIYNDLFFYKISRNEWMLTKAPGGPPPRCGHQMIAISIFQGQLWLFGGEYASPTQEQFYHYRDLWVFHLGEKKWEKINAPGGPSARSGHRMVCVKKQIFVFGGYHDVLRDYKYYNDVHVFDIENYTWTKLEPSGTPPAPRSACSIASLPDGRILIYGGYSKTHLKKDVDKGTVHKDMFLLVPDKRDSAVSKWKWMPVKAGGVTVSPRCGMAFTVVPGGKAFAFGGVSDIEDDEDICGTFFNDIYMLELEKQCWRTVQLSGKRNRNDKKGKKKKTSPTQENLKEGEGDQSNEETEDTTVGKESVASTSVIEDGVFTMTLGPSCSGQAQVAQEECEIIQPFMPVVRMNCGLAVNSGNLYLYGGLKEEGDRLITYSDFYSLDYRKLDDWKVIIPNDLVNQEWFESSSSSSEDEGDEDEEDDKENENKDDKENANDDDDKENANDDDDKENENEDDKENENEDDEENGNEDSEEGAQASGSGNKVLCV